MHSLEYSEKSKIIRITENSERKIEMESIDLMHQHETVLDKDDVEDNDDEDETEEQATPDISVPKEQKSKKSKNAKNPIGFKG